MRLGMGGVGNAHLAGIVHERWRPSGAPASYCGGLGARRDEKIEGKWRGADGLFIGQKKERNQAFNGRIMARDRRGVYERDLQREEEERVTSR